MRRLFRLSILVVLLGTIACLQGYAQNQVFVSGRLSPNDVRVFVKDTTYIIDRDFLVAGTLIIEPGTTVKFYPNGRLIDSTGGRIIADGLAAASYTSNPGGLDPIQPAGSPNNLPGFSGYADLNYFLYTSGGKTVNVNTNYDKTVHNDKADVMWRVVLNTNNRTIENLSQLDVGQTLTGGRIKISYEAAIMFYAARLQNDPTYDINLNQRPWSRIGGKSVNVTNGRILFQGQAVNSFSREWGHIIILPGARAAFFRNCDFMNFRKDVTVDDRPMFNTSVADADYATLNSLFTKLQNGSGGVIATYSARTWLLGCTFRNNMARHKGGALAIFQTPDGFPVTPNLATTLGYYQTNKNPNITEPDGSNSKINTRYRIIKIDNIDEPGVTEGITNGQRRAYDDGRLAVLMGRMRNLKFENNMAKLSDVGEVQIGTPPVTVVKDIDTAAYPKVLGNFAYGGAIYMTGKDGQPGEDSQMEVAFGINNSINTSVGTLTFSDDSFEATGNKAENYQAHGSTLGARGGAIFVDKYSSLMVAGKFVSNETYAKYFNDPSFGPNLALYSRGGAIFMSNTYTRLTVKGGPKRDAIPNSTEFSSNRSGAGGAIYQDGNTDSLRVTPMIGGSDVSPNTRDYGYNIKFLQNTASAFGGAIYTKRNMAVNGAGGLEPLAQTVIGYGGNFPVLFEKNNAGYAGGAIHIQLPFDVTVRPVRYRTCQIVRAEFRDNQVGSTATTDNRSYIRGGGAVYSVHGDMTLIKGSLFLNNQVNNGNGGALALINPQSSVRRYFISDIDAVTLNEDGVVTSFASNDDAFTFKNTTSYQPDARMMTRFLDNTINADKDLTDAYENAGDTQVGDDPRVSHRLFTIDLASNVNGLAAGEAGYAIKFNAYNVGGHSPIVPRPYNQRIMGAKYLGTNTWVMVGFGGRVVRSIDNGATWSTVVNFLDTNTVVLNAVDNAAAIVFAVGTKGTILKSTDYGATWATITTPSMANLNTVDVFSSTFIVAAGDGGAVLVTTDGGTTWAQRSVSSLFYNIRSVYFVDNSTGYAAGTTGSYNISGSGAIFKTTNGGTNWSIIKEDAGIGYQGIFANANTIVAVGDLATVVKSTNAGVDWTTIQNIPHNDINPTFHAVTFRPDNYGYIACDYGMVLYSTDLGDSWNELTPPLEQKCVNIARFHPEIGTTENGIGLGGAIYILDSATVDRRNREDWVYFNRVRIQNNKAYTGAAIYSDNFNLKLIFNRSLITTNSAYSTVGLNQNFIKGPVQRDANCNWLANRASSDLASAAIYGEIQGPVPPDVPYTEEYTSWAANSIYNNKARFIIRLPDGPNTKGVLAGSIYGFGGTDTLRGNYWGRTEANVTMTFTNPFLNTPVYDETFFIDSWYKTSSADTWENQFGLWNQTYLKFMIAKTSDPREQGPFESKHKYTYDPVPFANGADENTVGANSIPAKALMSGLVYDIIDKGTDIKTADYAKRRMSPIEDYAVGIPPVLRRFTDDTKPSYNKYIKRWLRDPFVAEARDAQNRLIYPFINAMQDEFRPDKDGNYYHPIGYPLYLESQMNYEGIAELSNHDIRALNESVFFVINETTGDFIRTNMRQVSENAPYREIFRTRVELVPDSSNRNDNTTLRRTDEGLSNIGIGTYLLEQIQFRPDKEDKAVMPGRRYSAATSALGKVPNLFINRPGMPVANNGQQTFYAGERYTALPVNVGDVVRIVSRTVLWREGVIPSFDGGISFTVVGSTEPPVWTGNIVHLQTDTVWKEVGSEYPWEPGVKKTIPLTEFLNKIWVTEGRFYPATPGTYTGLTLDEGQGRDSILTTTALDTNHFWDPRSFHLPNVYPQFWYKWDVSLVSGLYRWLQVDTIPAGDNIHENPRDEALGYLTFRGNPINPYVVPGGEDVNVSAQSFPPSGAIVDYLKSIGLPQDTIDKYILIYRAYLAQNVYNNPMARFLQQDTIGFGSNNHVDYAFKLFVVNTPPEFAYTSPNGKQMDWVATQAEASQGADSVYRRLNSIEDRNTPGYKEELWVVYKPSVYTCGMTSDDPLTPFPDRKLKANLTNKLRFQADFNTNDELEDAWARNWDFRYGKTAYGFKSVTVSLTDTTVIDSTSYDNNLDGVDDGLFIRQNKPFWMDPKYMYTYDNENAGSKDAFGADFTTYGRLNIRIDSLEADKLLQPSIMFNNNRNVDTVMTIIANDGHGGMTTKSMRIFVNYQPAIITTSLPAAKEDFDYNPQLLDSTRMILVWDPNFEQEHRFALTNDQDWASIPDTIWRDPCFHEAGYVLKTDLPRTPNWLWINPVSGLLYGTPGIKDAPKQVKVTVVCWDIVDGENQLPTIKIFDMQVDSTNHKPHISAAPLVRCIDEGKPYSDTLLVSDYDLLRGDGNPGDVVEELNIKAYDKDYNELTNFQIIPNNIKGTKTEKDVKIIIKTDVFSLPKDPDGKVTIIVIVTDASGMTDTLIYRLKYSDPTDFIVPMTIENTKPGDNPGEGKFATQVLEWGVAPRNATTGEGLDNEKVGTLDYNFCEYELPPTPPTDVFDSRWTISLTNGTHRNIFPRCKQGVQDYRVYKGRIQGGGEANNVSLYYPVSISWNKNDIPDKTDATRNPCGSQWFIRDAGSNGNLFNYNMKTGEGTPGLLASTYGIHDEGTRWRVQIDNPTVKEFIIVYDWASGINDQPLATETGIASVTPNPVTNTAVITFGITNSAKTRLDVIDELGHIVAVISDGDYTPGRYDLTWNTEGLDGKPLVSGTYRLRLTSGTVTDTKPMVIVK